MCPIEEIFTHDQGNVTEKKVQWQKMALFLEGIQMGLQALCDEAIAETSSCTFPFPASGAVAPRVSATPRHPLRTRLPRVLVTPPFSTRGHAPESASLPPTSGTGWGHRQGGDSYTWRPGPGTFWRFGPVQGQLFRAGTFCS